MVMRGRHAMVPIATDASSPNNYLVPAAYSYRECVMRPLKFAGVLYLRRAQAYAYFSCNDQEHEELHRWNESRRFNVLRQSNDNRELAPKVMTQQRLERGQGGGGERDGGNQIRFLPKKDNPL